MNPTEEDMDIICFIGIAIDENNDPTQKNIPEQQYQQKGN